MIMPKNKREIEKNDIMPLDVYTKKRKELRKGIVEYKKNRRVPLGPYATFYFESYETMLAQVQEMLYIEKGGDEQLKDELTAYNPLIPNGKELVATLMVEIDSPIKRADFLGKMGGFEENLDVIVNNKVIKGNPESDVERTTAEGKASSVQFVHFDFNDECIKSIKTNKDKVSISINHENYKHSAILNIGTVEELTKDFVV